jgi:hypothetical protein
MREYLNTKVVPQASITRVIFEIHSWYSKGPYWDFGEIPSEVYHRTFIRNILTRYFVKTSAGQSVYNNHATKTA